MGDQHHRVEHKGLRYRDMDGHHTQHELHRELTHQFDDQHDIEPVHYHEHAIHRAFDTGFVDEHDLNLGQVSSKDQSKDQKKTDDKKQEQKPKQHITDMRPDFHHRHLTGPHSVLPTI